MKRLGLAGVIAALFVLAACENPLVVELQQQIDQEVAVQELGEVANVSTTPVDGDVGVSATTTVTVVFSQDMTAESVTASVLLRTGSGTEISGTATYDAESRTLTFDPDEPLTPGTTYRFVISADTLESAVGLTLSQDESFQFTTSSRPIVASVSPEDGAEDEPLSPEVVVTFDRAMDGESVEAALSVATDGGTEVDGTVVYEDTDEAGQVTFTPAADLDVATTYVVTVGASAASTEGTTLGTDFTSEFTTNYFAANEIGIDFTYTGTLEVSADRPVYLFAYVLPFSTDFESNPALYTAAVTGTPMVADGRYTFSTDDLPGNADMYLLRLVHDLNNSFVGDEDPEEETDVQNWIKVGATGNTIPISDENPFVSDGSGPIIEDGYFVIKDEFKVSVGSEVVVDLYNESPLAEDSFEDDDNGSYRPLSLGEPEIARNLHSLDDLDYFTFTTGTNDHYDVKIDTTDFQTEVLLFESESHMVTQSNQIAGSTGTAERVINTSRRELEASTTYYLSVSSPEGGLGDYTIGFELRPVPNESPADINEPNESPDSPTTLDFGRTNAIAAVAGDDNDQDVYEIQVTDDVWYAIEVTESDNYFGSWLEKRDIDFKITMYTDWSPGGPGSGIWDANSERFYEVSNGRVFFRDSTEVEGDTETRWIVVSNETEPQDGDDGPRPTAEYSVAMTWGPDANDKAYDDTEMTAVYDDDADTRATAPYTNLFYPGPEEQFRTIYSGDDGSDPGDDIDWVRLNTEGLGTEYKIIAGPASGEDGVHVNVELYESIAGADVFPDTADGPQRALQPWVDDSEGKGGFYFAPYTLDDDFDYTDFDDKIFWLKVTRDNEVSGNPAAGRYSIIFDAGADDEDNQYTSSSDPDIQVSVTGTENGDYGIDETPWLDGFEDRNRLEWSEDPGTVSYPSTHAVVGFASETYWSIYRKDYSSRAEPDGTTDPSTDVDFFWMQFDEGDSDPLNDLPDDGSDDGTDPDLRLDLSSQGNPGMPLKVTYWLLSDATWTSIRDNNEGLVVTEGELGTATGSLFSTFDGSQFQISEEIDGIVDGSVLVFKIERDNAGADVDDPNSGQYYFRLQDI